MDEILRQILLPFIYAGSFLIKGSSTQERGSLHLLDIWTATLSATVLDETRYDTGNQDTWRGLSLLFVHPTQS